ncbi:MAG: hypothetical protein HZY75_12460 [Nocardioidaceae bacterium]|nr:MAG: hypothetical protein HZY75_12460 [Nocardioidaceae bacterium]
MTDLRPLKDLRKVASGLVIASFSIAALLGIAVLLGAGSFGETEGRVLLTTLIVGVESIAVLCYLSVVGHRFAFLGAVGVLVSFVATGLALWITWGGSSATSVWQGFGISLTIAASLAQMCLLLATAGRTRVSPPLWATLAAITVVAVMVILPILEVDGLGDTYWRAFGVVAILDVLGTVVLTAIGVFGKRDHSGQPIGPASLQLGEAVATRVSSTAMTMGLSADELISRALEAYEAANNASDKADFPPSGTSDL